jgi:hypothetical protein
MRKKVWGCAVAAVIAMLGGGLAINYACDHPDSWLGRCLFNAPTVAANQFQSLGVTGHAAKLAFQSVQGLLGQGGGVVCPDGDQCPGPRCPDEVPMEPAVLPGGVAMHEEQGALPAAPMPPVHDFIGGLPAGGGTEESEEGSMPRAEDDAVKMPRVEECEEDCCHAGTKANGEKCEPVVPKLKHRFERKPKHPDVDTMEIRPSDLWFLDFTGPF